MKNIQNLTIDINKKTFQTITANAGEVASRFIKITILENNMPVDLTGVTAYLYAKKADGTKVFNTVEVEDAKQGILSAEITSQILAIEGLVKLTLLLTKDKARLVSKIFNLRVDETIVDDEAIESSNEFTALTNALAGVNNIDSRLKEVNSQLEQVASKGTTVEVLERVTKEEIDRQIKDGTIANLTIKNNSITEEKLNGNITKKLEATKYLDVVNNGFMNDGIIKRINSPQMLNQQNGNVSMSGVRNWATPFVYNGSTYTELYIPYLSVDVDTTLTIAIAGRGLFDNAIIKKECSVKKGEYKDFYIDLSINNSILNQGTVYWLYLSVSSNVSTFKVSKCIKDRTASSEYLIPQGNYSLYPSLYNNDWGTAVQGYDICAGFVKKEDYIYKSITDAVLESDKIDNAVNKLEDYTFFKQDVLKYERVQDTEYEHQNLCELTSKYDALDYGIQTYALHLDKTKINNFNAISCKFKVRDTAKDVCIKVFVLDGTSCDLKYMIASGYSDKFDVTAKEVYEVTVGLKDKSKNIVDINMNNIQNNLYVGYMILDKDLKSTVRFACNIATDLNSYMVGSYYTSDVTSETVSKSYSSHIKSPFSSINLSYIKTLDTFKTSCELGEYFPNIPVEKIIGFPGSELLKTYLPSEIPVIEGETFELFLDSIIDCKNHKVYNIEYTGTLKNFKSNDRKLYLPNAKIGDGGTFTLSFKDDYGRLMAQQTSTITVYPKYNPVTIKNVLIIGDSVTQQANTPKIIKSRLTSDNITNIRFIGKRGDGHEGRSGWKIDDYLRKYYNNTEGESNLNPFWNDAKNDVDFINYCNVNNYERIDYCIIHLNWNNMLTPVTLAKKYKLLVDKILRDYPNCIIFTVGFDGYASNRIVGPNDVTKKLVFEYTEEREREFEDYPNVKTIHLLHEIDNEYAHYWSSIPVNTRKTDVTEGILGDYIHSQTVGYSQTADVYYRALISDMYNNQYFKMI